MTEQVACSAGMNHFPHPSGITFGTIETTDDGSLNNLPSPQQAERPNVARSPPGQSKASNSAVSIPSYQAEQLQTPSSDTGRSFEATAL